MIEDPQILVCFEESLMVQVYCLAGTYSMTQGEGLDAQDKTTDCKVWPFAPKELTAPALVTLFPA